MCLLQYNRVVNIRGYIGIMEKKMETAIMGYTGGYVGFNIGLYGWLSKLWSLLGYPNRDPKRDHNSDNHPCAYCSRRS